MQAQSTSQKLGGRNWEGIHMNRGERKICYGKLLGKEIKRQDVWADLSRNGAGCLASENPELIILTPDSQEKLLLSLGKSSILFWPQLMR